MSEISNGSFDARQFDEEAESRHAECLAILARKNLVNDTLEVRRIQCLAIMTAAIPSPGE